MPAMDRKALAEIKALEAKKEYESHMAMYDDQRTYFDGVTAFLHDVETGTR